MAQKVKRWIVAADVQKGEKIPSDKVTFKQTCWGVGAFSTLFFLWGLAYGLLDIMNYHVKVAIGTSRTSAAMLALAYYLAYIPGSILIGGPLIKVHGYRFAAVVGVVLVGVGGLVMSHGASLLSLAIMCAGHLVVGLGVSTLERTANTYVVNLGKRAAADFRILFAQTWAAIGTIIAPIIANACIFDAKQAGQPPMPDPMRPGRCLMPPPPDKGEAGDLTTVVTFYRAEGLALFGFAALLGLFFFGTRLVVEPLVPKTSKLDQPAWQIWKHPLMDKKYARMWWGVSANFLNLGCQVCVAQFFMEQVRTAACNSDTQAAGNMRNAQIFFAVGRIVAAGLTSLRSLPALRGHGMILTALKGRSILSVFLAGAVALVGAGIGAKGLAAIICACAVMAFEAPSFPLIFETATAGLGELTPLAETLTIVSISGGGVLPVIMGQLADSFGLSKAWGLIVAAFGYVWIYSLACNIVPQFRHAIDAAHHEVEHKSSEADVEMRSQEEESH